MTVAQLVRSCTNDIESIEIFTQENTGTMVVKCKSLDCLSDDLLGSEVKTWNYQNDDAEMYILI